MWVALLLLAIAGGSASAQTSPETIVLLRTATFNGAYKYAQAIHQRGRWIPADVGYIDFDHPGQYREMWIGGGGVPFRASNAALTTEALLLKTFGQQANDQLYLQLFFLASYRPAANVAAEAVYLPYLPLNDAGTTQHLVERAKLEYELARFKVGAGYGGYKFGDGAWNHKPFVTTTYKGGGAGNFELWLQRVPGDALSLQIRYAKVFVR